MVKNTRHESIKAYAAWKSVMVGLALIRELDEVIDAIGCTLGSWEATANDAQRYIAARQERAAIIDAIASGPYRSWLAYVA